MREPEFIGGEVDLRINIYRGQVDGIDLSQYSVDGSRTAGKLPESEQEELICKFVIENGFITTMQATELLGIKQRRAREILAKMVGKKWLKKEGASRSTVYIRN